MYIMVASPWFAGVLRAPGGGRLWQRTNRRKMIKELSESACALRAVQRARDARGGQSPERRKSGAGGVVLDVGCGRGLTALLLAVRAAPCGARTGRARRPRSPPASDTFLFIFTAHLPHATPHATKTWAPFSTLYQGCK